VLLGTLATALALAIATGCGDDDDESVASDNDHATASAAVHTEGGHEIQDAMRVLWNEHGNLTVRAIVAAVEELPETEAVVNRLLENQTKIGDAIKPYYGDEAGEQLTKLLEDHINDAVAVLSASTGGDTKAAEKASDVFYANGDEIAKFLSDANPENWPLETMKDGMRAHLDQVVALATAQIEGDAEAALDEYETYIEHINHGLADTLSDGILAQFPEQFE
jgi:hypothetical protein